jgi:DNA-binding MarR family transcriptional regulator
MEETYTRRGAELVRLARQCRGIDKHVSASLGLSVDEIHCLSVLFSEKPSSVKTLSDLITVSSTRASKILRDLEQRGFVSRTMDVADHRKEHVLLTANGAQVVEKILMLYNEIGIRFLGNGVSDLPTSVTDLLQAASHPD